MLFTFVKWESIVAVVNPTSALSKGVIQINVIFKTLQFARLMLKVTMDCVCMCNVLCNLIGR